MKFIKNDDKTKCGHRYGIYQCSCGEIQRVLVYLVRSGKVRNCKSCSYKETGKRFTKHGLSTTDTYKIWSGVVARCTKKNNQSYPQYGGRGIGVCDRWLNFENFYADMGPRPAGLSLDRIDNNGGYKKSNCRWATRSQQQNNMSSNKRIEYNGMSKTYAEWQRVSGVDAWNIRYRFKKGWSAKDSIFKKVRSRKDNEKV